MNTDLQTTPERGVQVNVLPGGKLLFSRWVQNGRFIMFLSKCTVLIAVPTALMAFASWRDKPVSNWTADDAKEVLTDSPWARRTVPTVQQQQSNGSRGGRGMGLPGGIGVNIPGMGGGRGGMGGQGRGPRRDDGGGRRGESTEPPMVTVRWESSAAIQSAVLKAKEDDAPTVDESHYTIAVVGLPRHLDRDASMSESKLKSQGELKRNGKKFAKPVDVRVIVRDDQMIVLYLFDRKKEISKNDTDIQLEAHLGRFILKQRFDPTEMIFDGKLAL